MIGSTSTLIDEQEEAQEENNSLVWWIKEILFGVKKTGIWNGHEERYEEREILNVQQMRVKVL